MSTDFFSFGIETSNVRMPIPPSSASTEFDTEMPGVTKTEAEKVPIASIQVDTVYFNVGLVALGVVAVWLLMR